MSRRALFLDRDGTLVEARHYPSRPEQLQLSQGVAPALRRLQQLGFALVVVTNQSGIARGYFGVAELDAMHAYLRGCLAAARVALDAIYYCPHHPDGAVPGFAVRCECRKPEPGMLQRAARDLDLDLASSWVVGDILDDVEAGKRVGCRTVLVDRGTETLDHEPLREPDYICLSTREALGLIAALEDLGAPAPPVAAAAHG